MFFFEILY
uniref:N.tabacum P20 with a leader peptide n=1 Tax=Nicotiana tabacum TaxID=4097 RepID=Q40530_TOBAC|nr:leader peptide [Nicotiana tabacum]